MTFYKWGGVRIDALHWRSLFWWGVSPADNEGILHRRVPTTWKGKMKNRLMWWPTKRAYLSAMHIEDGDIAAFIDDLARHDIQWLQGYCAALEHVADYILCNNVKVKPLKMVWSTSSPLTPALRKKFAKAFGCPVMDQYGCMEMGNIASQKPGEQYLTIHSDYVRLDIVDDDDKLITETHGKGDILITDLRDICFPLIKYRLGDRSHIEKDYGESEDGYRKLAFVKGRISDSIMCPDGGRINGDYLTSIADFYADALLSYQIYQDKNYSVEIRIVLADGVKQEDKRISKMVKAFKDLVKDSGIEVTLKPVGRISDFAGKRKFIISELAVANYNEKYSQ